MKVCSPRGRRPLHGVALMYCSAYFVFYACVLCSGEWAIAWIRIQWAVMCREVVEQLPMALESPSSVQLCFSGSGAELSSCCSCCLSGWLCVGCCYSRYLLYFPDTHYRGTSGYTLLVLLTALFCRLAYVTRACLRIMGRWCASNPLRRNSRSGKISCCCLVVIDLEDLEVNVSPGWNTFCWSCVAAHKTRLLPRVVWQRALKDVTKTNPYILEHLVCSLHWHVESLRVNIQDNNHQWHSSENSCLKFPYGLTVSPVPLSDTLDAAVTNDCSL